MGKLINCECGYVVRGADEDEVVRRAQEHVEADHPDLVGQISREQFVAMSEDE
jgi:predicted small metal-binding protein